MFRGHRVLIKSKIRRCDMRRICKIWSSRCCRCCRFCEIQAPDFADSRNTDVVSPFIPQHRLIADLSSAQVCTRGTMFRAGLTHHIPTTRPPDHHPTSTTSPPDHPQHPNRTPPTRHGPTRWDLSVCGNGIYTARRAGRSSYVVSCMSTSMQRETKRPLIPATRPRTPTVP